MSQPTDPISRFSSLRRELESRWPEQRIDPTLARIKLLTSYLGDPQAAYPVIQVTGTNGKTSTARMIETLLRTFGLKTGLMTSPHLSDLRERIRLDGEPISIERFLEVYDEVAPVLELADRESEAQGGPPLSFFEVITALGFAAFADAPVDVAIVEVGMGGRWDASNVADAAVAVIAPIGMDHAEYLGPDVETIAAEKAGIIKGGSTLVLAAQEPGALRVLMEHAGGKAVPVVLEAVDFGVAERAVAHGGQLLTFVGLGGEYPDVFLPLFGTHQARNAALALAAVESFFGVTAHPDPPRRLDPQAVAAGFAAVTSPGRLEVVRRSPTVLVDAAHNPHGAAALAAALADSFAFSRLVAVIGMVKGKDARGLFEALEPVVDEVVISHSTSPRAWPVTELAEIAEEVLGPDRVRVVERLDDALDLAIELAETATPSGVGAGVIVTGSVFTAAEARLLLGAEADFAAGETSEEHFDARGLDPEDHDLERAEYDVAGHGQAYLDEPADPNEA
ncbi:MAG: bifunctional folylpolyglutamate synthase/dihydrofolate synthase [Candidatus Nanopelagicales bacterium]